ncbi:MAG: helix-turn-helix transcriptional regulator [Clostridiaceae bacterium]|nr:helix-turn-helix transcriptional regulator [Clostridiaceae bacterium]
MSIFNERLQKLKEEKGMQSKDIAETFKITPSKVSYYMRGAGEPSYDLLIQFSNFFDVTTDYLIGRTNQRNKEAESAIENIKLKAGTEPHNKSRISEIENYSGILYNVLVRIANIEASEESYDDIWTSVKKWLDAMQNYCIYLETLPDDPYPIDIAKAVMDSLTESERIAAQRIFKMLRDICIDEEKHVPQEIKKRVIMHSSFGIRPQKSLDSNNSDNPSDKE